MLHFISQSSDTRKIKNFFEHHRLDDGKNLLKPHKNSEKNSGRKTSGRYSCILSFQNTVSHLFHIKGWKNFVEFRINSNVLVIKNQVTKKTAARLFSLPFSLPKILHNEGIS